VYARTVDAGTLSQRGGKNMNWRNRGKIVCTLLVLSGLLIVPISTCFAQVDIETPITEKVTIDWQQFAGTTINLICERSPGNEGARMMIPEFEKLTGINVNLIMLPERALFDKMAIDLSTGSGMYDFVQMPACGVCVRWAKAGWIESLNKYIEDPTLTDKAWLDVSDFVEKWTGTMSYKGELYGLPSYGESDILFYRTDLFLQKGVGIPTTTDELFDAAQKLTLDTDGDGKADIFGITLRGIRGHTSNIYIWTGFLRAFGGKFFAGGDVENGMPPGAPKGKENWMPVLNSPEAVAATDFYGRLLKTCAPPDAPSYHWYGVLRTMMEGKTAMMIDATCFGPPLNDPAESKVVGKVGYAPGPQIPSIWVSGFAINSASKNKGATWFWLQWVTSKETQLKYSAFPESETCDVSRWSVIEDPRYQERWHYPSATGDFMTIAWDNIAKSSPDYRPRIPEYWEIGDILGSAVEEVLAGIKPAEKALDEAQSEIVDIMKGAGYF